MSKLIFELPVPRLGAWRKGNTGTEGVWTFGATVPSPRVLVTALVHGKELCGAWALLGALQTSLRPRRGSLTLAFCNLAAFDVFDPLQADTARFLDEDMNRVWGEGLRDRPASREQTRACALLPFVEQADCLLDLHSMHEPGVPLPLTGMHQRNVDLAHQIGTPTHSVVDAGHKDGCRLRDHGAFGRADAHHRALLLESGYHGELSSRDVALDMLARFLVAVGSVEPPDIPDAWWRPLPPVQHVLHVTGGIVAHSMNLRFAQPWKNGQVVAEAGTVLGWSDDESLVTPYSHCTIVMPSLRQLRPGVTVMRLARQSVESPVYNHP